MGTSLNELVGMLESALGQPIKRRYLPTRPFDVPVSVLSNDLARQELDWAPVTDMQMGIVRTAQWMATELAS